MGYKISYTLDEANAKDTLGLDFLGGEVFRKKPRVYPHN
jgi:hypothetical protein